MSVRYRVTQTIQLLSVQHWLLSLKDTTQNFTTSFAPHQLCFMLTALAVQGCCCCSMQSA